MHPSYVDGDSLRRANGSREESPTRSAFNRWVSECTCRRINQAQPRNSAYLGHCPSPHYILEVITSVCEKTEKCLRYSQKKEKLVPEYLGWFNSITAFFYTFPLSDFSSWVSSIQIEFQLDAFKQNYVTLHCWGVPNLSPSSECWFKQKKIRRKTTRFPHSQAGVKFVLFILFYARIVRGATIPDLERIFWGPNYCKFP